MNEKRLATFTSVLQGIQFLAMVYALVIVILWFIKGGVWFKEEVLPLHGGLFFILLVLTFIVLIPLMVIKTTRPYSGLILFQMTYIFGGIAWFYSAHYCLYFLGIFWFVIGLFVVGVGVAPIAVVGAIIKGHWEFVAFIVVQLVATFGCRALAAYAVSTSEE
jgi:hypothetical protein